MRKMMVVLSLTLLTAACATQPRNQIVQAGGPGAKACSVTCPGGSCDARCGEGQQAECSCAPGQPPKCACVPAQ